MPRITEREIEASYELAKQVYEKQTSLEDAVEKLVSDYQMNETSASISITYFQHFIEGKRYGRALNEDHTRHYMESVLRDYGDDKLKIFLKGLEEHIEYRNEIGHSVRNLRKIHNEFSERIDVTPIFEPHSPHNKIAGKGINKFEWVPFYESFSNNLLKYKSQRTELAEAVCNIASNDVNTFTIKQGDHEPSDDIDPFTVISFFTQGHEDHVGNIEKRQNTISELCQFFKIPNPQLKYFAGLPTSQSRNRLFFAPPGRRGEDDIDTLWNFFELAMNFADSEGKVSEESFIKEFNEVINIKQVGGNNISMGLYWTKPNFFPTLEGNTQEYIKDKFGIEYKKTGENYLSIRKQLLRKFEEGNEFGITSFPELADKAYIYANNKEVEIPNEDNNIETAKPELKSEERTPYRDYTIRRIIEDGCFISEEKLNDMLERFEKKQNLILQGPPGTGKTWLAKRLGFALMGKEDRGKIELVQFHPNMSYEDFVMGYRPSDGDKTLERENGIFLKLCDKARANPDEKYVVVIEEINRGNPAQIFGELLTLLESDKRMPSEALRLSYQKDHEEKFYIPKNLYVIGTMNLADRSLALVDIALRRRFAFENLQPLLNDAWLQWANQKGGIDTSLLETIRRNINALNDTITNDSALREQFCIGHSYVTPNDTVPDAAKWYREIVRTEIKPLLEEYWFDNPEKIEEGLRLLSEGINE